MYNEFGFWKEYGERYIDSPSIYLYRNKTINESYDKNKLVNYLNSGGIIAVSSKINFPHIFKDIERSGDFLLLTDGVWVWPEDLADYVLHHDVILPDEWYAYIVRNNFMVSEEIKSKHEDVDWRD